MMMSSSSSPDQKISISLSSNWKLYQNPLYNNSSNLHPHHYRGQNTKFPHHRLSDRSLPSDLKTIAVPFWDLSFFRPATPMGHSDDMAEDLRAELDRERRARRKLEHVNKKLGKDLAEERRGREAIERVCEELAKDVACHMASIDRLKREIEEERRMLRVAEALREERVQMKLAEAYKVFLEPKMSEFEEKTTTNTTKEEEKDTKTGAVGTVITASTPLTDSGLMDQLVLVEKRLGSSEGNVGGCNGDRSKAAAPAARRILSTPSPEPENPHIKMGIKGFVEFPRVVRAIGSKGRSWGSKKIEGQKAQIRILLKQKSCSVRSTGNDSLIWGL